MRLFFVSMLTCFAFFQVTHAEKQQFYRETIPWVETRGNFLEQNDQISQYFIIVGENICHHDTLDSTLCFSFGWRDACLEIYATFMLDEQIAYILAQDKVPVLQVDNYNKIDFGSITKLETKENPLMPRINWDEVVFWRAQFGSLQDIQINQEGLFYQLMNGEDITLFFPLQNGTIMRSHSTLLGIKPLLANVIQKAEAINTSGQICHPSNH